MNSFPYHKQVQIMVRSMAIHNYIRNHVIKDFRFEPYDNDEIL